MKAADVRNLPSMPLASPSYPRGPYRFIDREYLIVTYESDPDAIREALPEPLEPDGSNTVLYEFIRLPDSAGFGDYTESGQVIPALFKGEQARQLHRANASRRRTADRRRPRDLGIPQKARASETRDCARHLHWRSGIRRHRRCGSDDGLQASEPALRRERPQAMQPAIEWWKNGQDAGHPRYRRFAGDCRA